MITPHSAKLADMVDGIAGAELAIDRDDQQRLDEVEPGPPLPDQSARNGMRDAVDQRRPEEFEIVGRAEREGEADRLLVDADLGQPVVMVASRSSRSGKPLEMPSEEGRRAAPVSK